MGAVLEICDLSVRFGAVEAVRGASLSVDEGEVLGLVGESGASSAGTPFTPALLAAVPTLRTDRQKALGVAVVSGQRREV